MGRVFGSDRGPLMRFVFARRSWYYGSYGAYFGQPVGGGGGEMYRGGGYCGPPAYYRR
jgi:hypothetical protein